MGYKRSLLAMGFGVVGLLAIPLQAEEGGGAICCDYSSECAAPFTQCNIVGADCDTNKTGNQGYCMKGDDLEY